MKAISAVAAVVMGLMAPVSLASAQSWGGGDFGSRDRSYRERDRYEDDRDRGYRDRDRGYRDGYRERERGYGDRRVGFDEGEYLRCNPDVRRAVRQGQFGGSGAAHYREYGRRENRRLSC